MKNPIEGRQPHHIGVLVRDVEQALSQAARAFAVPVAEPGVMAFEARHADGVRPVEIKVGFAMFGTLMFEFIEPLNGPNQWSETLERRGPGLHHIAFNQIHDLDDAVAASTSADFVQSVDGRIEDVHWCYLENESIVLELLDGEGPVFPRD